MQVDFAIPNNNDPLELVIERKVGTLIKTYRPRTVQFGFASLKYVSDGAEKGEDSLVGATIFASPNGIELKLKLKDTKEPALFRAKTTTEAEVFVNHVRKAIRRANVRALQNGSRDAEVVEWYYQYQADLAKEAAFMSNKHIVHMCHTLPGQQEIRRSYFHVTMPIDRSGLLFTLDRTTSDGNPPSKFANLYNGRIVLFTEINGVFLPGGVFQPDATGGLSFVLQTKEDELNLHLPTRGVEWLRAVQALCIFTKIPVPSSRTSAAASSPSASASHQNLADFSTNSVQSFSPSGDVLLVLQQLADKPNQSAGVIALCEEMSGVLRSLPEVRCNKEAMHVLGARVEETVRVFGGSDTGIVHMVREEERGAFETQVGTLKAAYADIRAYLKIQRYAGWLRHHVESSSNAKTTLEGLDANLMAALNRMISTLNMSSALMFERREYVCAADVRKCVESLGGLDAIYQDTIKERSLAKLVQADGAEIARELAKMHGVVFTGSQRSVHTSFTGVDSTNPTPAPPSRSCWYYLCCCGLFGSSTQASSKANRKKATPSLHEPLVG